MKHSLEIIIEIARRMLWKLPPGRHTRDARRGLERIIRLAQDALAEADNLFGELDLLHRQYGQYLPPPPDEYWNWRSNDEVENED